MKHNIIDRISNLEKVGLKIRNRSLQISVTSFSEIIINYFFKEIVEFEGSLVDFFILPKRLHNILKESSISISIMPGKCCILGT